MVITTFFYYKSITTLVQTLILYSRTKSSDIQAVCVYAYQLLPVKRGGGVDGRSEHAMMRYSWRRVAEYSVYCEHIRHTRAIHVLVQDSRVSEVLVYTVI